MKRVTARKRNHPIYVSISESIAHQDAPVVIFKGPTAVCKQNPVDPPPLLHTQTEIKNEEYKGQCCGKPVLNSILYKLLCHRCTPSFILYVLYCVPYSNLYIGTMEV